jgi:hypothetical protein
MAQVMEDWIYDSREELFSFEFKLLRSDEARLSRRESGAEARASGRFSELGEFPILDLIHLKLCTESHEIFTFGSGAFRSLVRVWG